MSSKFTSAQSFQLIWSWHILRYGLGILWLVDALLQLQPGMFHTAFYGNLPSNTMPSMLQGLHDDAPTWIAWAIALTQWFLIRWPIVVNLFITLVQLVLAALLLLRTPVMYHRIAAWGSILWGLAVWVFGEALGGVGSWGSTFYAGFPGSALVYAFAGGLLLIREERWKNGQASKLAIKSIALYFLICGILQLLPINGQWDLESQMSVFANSGFQSQPSLLSDPVMAYTMWVSSHPVADNVILGALLILAAVLVWFWRNNRIGRWFVYAFLFLSWWFGMDFGFLFSGLSTDPNTPPILFVILLACATVPRRLALSKNKPFEVTASES